MGVGLHMPGSVVEEIKARLDIADVVSEVVALKKAGKSLKGLCPFHTEKTPSFVVFPETGTWHCFGCGEGGDIFNFVMRSRNVEFGDALAILASRAGVELPTRERERRIDEGVETLYAVNEAAAAYYRSMLAGPLGARARGYLQQREISAESVDSFQLGYAPDTGAGLAHHLLQQGFGRAELLHAGLAGESESGGLYDRFRARLIFPIRDAAGKLVGFGGRGLSADVQPKYLNTPQTSIFDKGGCLYAVDRAKQEIRRTGQAVIVEGYVDALMAHQHGFHNVVASLGTAVTERQLSQLKRWASEVCFALDPDVAGQEATARGLAVAMNALEHATTPVPTWKGLVEYVYQLKTTIKIIALPEGRDPDELIRQSSEEWQRLVREAVPVQDFFLDRVRRKHDLSSASGKAAAVEEAMGVIGAIPDPVQQAHYVQRLAALVGIEEAILLQQVRRPRHRRSPEMPSPPGTKSRPGADVEGYCLALLLKEPSLLDGEPKLREDDFGDPVYREIFRRVVQCRGSDPAEMRDRVMEGLAQPLQEGFTQLLELQLQYPVHFGDPLEKAYKSAAVTLLLRSLSLRKQQLEAMRSEEDTGAEADETVRLAQIEQQIAREAHRLKLLGGAVPLRAIHKEVRHGR